MPSAACCASSARDPNPAPIPEPIEATNNGAATGPVPNATSVPAIEPAIGRPASPIKSVTSVQLNVSSSIAILSFPSFKGFCSPKD